MLHHSDKGLLLNGYVGYEHLVTIRRGEPVYNPVRDRLERVSKEIVKVAGTGEDWRCCFYDEAGTSCSLYEHRFLECRLLKCWDTSDIMRVIGRDTILRTDIMNRTDPIVDMIEIHERECSGDEVERLIADILAGNEKEKPRVRMAELVAKDVSLRTYAVSELGLKAEYERFIFGRPLSRLLADRGLAVLTQP